MLCGWSHWTDRDTSQNSGGRSCLSYSVSLSGSAHEVLVWFGLMLVSPTSFVFMPGDRPPLPLFILCPPGEPEMCSLPSLLNLGSPGHLCLWVVLSHSPELCGEAQKQGKDALAYAPSWP